VICLTEQVWCSPWSFVRVLAEVGVLGSWLIIARPGVGLRLTACGLTGVYWTLAANTLGFHGA
jgi:hypothetical protein